MKRKMKSTLLFRPMTLNDIPFVMNIEKRVYTAPWPEYLYRSELTNSPFSYYTVAIMNHKIVGYAGMKLRGHEAHLTTMVVDLSFQGVGIGEAILKHKIPMMKEKGATSISLEVRVSNKGAQKLYHKYGFVEVGRKKSYYPDNAEDALMMKLLPIPSILHSKW